MRFFQDNPNIKWGLIIFAFIIVVLAVLSFTGVIGG